MLGVGIGLYSYSRASHAKSQSSNQMSGNENGELTARASKKSDGTPGKAEKETNKAGGSSQDNKLGLAVESKKLEKDSDKDSKTGNVKSGRDESGRPKAEMSGKGDDSAEKESSEKNQSTNSEETNNEKAEGEEGEDEEGQGPIGIRLEYVINYRS